MRLDSGATSRHCRAGRLGGPGGGLRGERLWGGTQPLRVKVDLCSWPDEHPVAGGGRSFEIRTVCLRVCVSGVCWVGRGGRAACRGRAGPAASCPKLSWVLSTSEGVCSACAGPEVSGEVVRGTGGAGHHLGISLRLPTANQTRERKETERSAS